MPNLDYLFFHTPCIKKWPYLSILTTVLYYNRKLLTHRSCKLNTNLK